MERLDMHLIFDLDGTLVDSHPGIQFAIQQAVKQIYPSYNLSSLNIKIGPSVRAMFEKAFSPVAATELDRLEAAFRHVYDGGAWKMTSLYQGVKETICTFCNKGIPCYIVTNKPFLASERILTFLEIAWFFVDTISPDSCQPTFRNKAEMIRYLFNRHNIPPENAFYIGDSVDDFQAAESCGLEFIGIESGYGIFPETKSFRKAKSFGELLSLIQLEETRSQ
jgi:phosphoglycolate phosphatase